MSNTRWAYEEIMLVKLHDLNYLMPHYWSNLLMLAEQFLTTEEEIDQLHSMIFDVEKMVFETEMVPVENDNGGLVWVEQIKGDLSLYDIEMAMESNSDFFSFFERDDGTQITKFDIERRLNKLKAWLYAKIRERSQGRRFQKIFR